VLVLVFSKRILLGSVDCGLGRHQSIMGLGNYLGIRSRLTKNCLAYQNILPTMQARFLRGGIGKPT
jgi:hypothetical protein